MNHCHWSSQTFFRSTNTKTYWYVENTLKNSIGNTVCDWFTTSQVKLRQPTHRFTRQDKFAHQYEQNTTKLRFPWAKIVRWSHCGMKRQAGSERKCRIWSGRETKLRRRNRTVRKSTVERMMNGEQSARVKAYVIANFHNSLIHFWSFSSRVLI